MATSGLTGFNDPEFRAAMQRMSQDVLDRMTYNMIADPLLLFSSGSRPKPPPFSEWKAEQERLRAIGPLNGPFIHQAHPQPGKWVNGKWICWYRRGIGNPAWECDCD